MSFNEFGLRVELLDAIKSKGYSAPTPIQMKAIPFILNGRDIFARAQTGTGKTDAFALPLVHILSQRPTASRTPRALVLTPTRELAVQVGETIQGYARRLSLRCTVVFGGVRIHPQIDKLKRGTDILVATPGRLLDLAGHHHVKLDQVEFLVFDEADRMLDLGFSDEISRIVDIMPEARMTLLFSATYTQEIRELTGRMLDNPEHIEVSADNKAAVLVLQKVHKVDHLNKQRLLLHLITKENWSQGLIFVRTKHGANKLSDALVAKNISAAPLHGNMTQSQRLQALDEFKKGNTRILVATDVAARGLDISNLPYVVNYNMPESPEAYIHRVGRTGRAGEKGTAISFVSHQEESYLKAIEDLLKQKLPVKKVTGYTTDSDVPDFVLYRPGSSAGSQKVDKDIVDFIDKKKASKKKSKIRLAKKAKKGTPSKSPSRSKKHSGKAKK